MMWLLVPAFALAVACIALAVLIPTGGERNAR